MKLKDLFENIEDIIIEAKDVEKGKIREDYSKLKVGSFCCSGNFLTTLQYAPTEVGGSFYCGSNQLTTLQHIDG